MDKKDIVVVVPIYLPALSEMEAVSLKQCLDILSDYSIVIIKPENLDISNIQSQFLLPKVISFPDRCFQGIEAYNRLMLDVAFIELFRAILICLFINWMLMRLKTNCSFGLHWGMIILVRRGCRTKENIGGFLLVSSGLSSVASGVFSILRICAE